MINADFVCHCGEIRFLKPKFTSSPKKVTRPSIPSKISQRQKNRIVVSHSEINKAKNEKDFTNSFWVVFFFERENRVEEVQLTSTALIGLIEKTCLKQLYGVRKIVVGTAKEGNPSLLASNNWSMDLKKPLPRKIYKHFSLHAAEQAYEYLMRTYQIRNPFFGFDFYELKQNYNFQMPTSVKFVPAEIRGHKICPGRNTRPRI